jgi:hypothetical protein
VASATITRAQAAGNIKRVKIGLVFMFVTIAVKQGACFDYLLLASVRRGRELDYLNTSVKAARLFYAD